MLIENQLKAITMHLLLACPMSVSNAFSESFNQRGSGRLNHSGIISTLMSELLQQQLNMLHLMLLFVIQHVLQRYNTHKQQH